MKSSRYLTDHVSAKNADIAELPGVIGTIYTDRAIEPENRTLLDALTQEINREAGLSIQIVYDDPKCFDFFMDLGIVKYHFETITGKKTV